jgi:DNA recombination protein RmuC
MSFELTPENLVIGLSAALAGMLLVALIAIQLLRKSNETHQAQLLAEQERMTYELEQVRFNLEKAEQKNQLLMDQADQHVRLVSELRSEAARLEERVKQFEAQRQKQEDTLGEYKSETHRLNEQGRADKAEIAELNTRLEVQEKHHGEKLQEFEQARKRMAVEFENLANRILEEKGQRLNEQSRKGMDEILKPVREQLSDFRKRVDEIYTHDTAERASLKQQLLQLQELNRQMNDEARNLTRALKGEKKTQGNWGELVLERVLEQSGLRKDREYEIQGSFKSPDGKLLRPDVVVHLPEGRDIIVDSKVSLVAYDDYVRAEDEGEQEKALDRLSVAIGNHIAELSNKNYENLSGVNSLDFVLMFMPIEPAFVAAFQKNPDLFSRAFEQKIVVVTPTTLLATLRTIENIWRFEKQNEHARRIADRASSIYDKLRGFLDDFERVGTQLETVHKTYGQARNKLVEGRGNLIRQAEGFVELGVKVKKSLPQVFRDDALLDEEVETPDLSD